MDDRILFNPSDWICIMRIMNEYGSRNEMMTGRSENGEMVFLSPYPDKLIVTTFQTNGWKRRNVYHRNGLCEEMYEGRWHDD